MLISDSFSEKTSSSLPILVSFSSHLNTKKIKKIRDFLRHQPNCQKYVKRGPTFVADGTNEFRLYYVDSSLYSDDITLKRLNVEKEEILFRSTSDDSLERSLRKGNIFHAQTKICRPENNMKKIDKASIYKERSHIDLRKNDSQTKVEEKVSKSVQIGSCLQFNAVYVNADIQCNSFKMNTVDACAQTVENHFSEALHEYQEESSPKLQSRCDLSFSPNNQSKADKQKNVLSTFKDFYSRLEEKETVLRKFTDDSIEPRKTSVKFSIKKSPPFVANYILEILNTKVSSRDITNSEIYEQSFLNCFKFDDMRRHGKLKRIYGKGNKNNMANCTNRLWYDNIQVKNELMNEKETKEPKKCYKSNQKYNVHSKSTEKRKKRSKYNRKYANWRKYHNAFEKPHKLNVECLYQCADMDLFMEKSHYAILKKYHKLIKEAKEKRDLRRLLRDKYLQAQAHNHDDKEKIVNANNDKNMQGRIIINHSPKAPHFRRKPIGDYGTKTTITEFLQSFNPWHWQNNSKLSVCVDDEYVPEDFFEDDIKYMGASPCRCGMSRIREYFAL